MLIRKNMEDTPTTALNSPLQRLASQVEQASQIHSSHHRAHESKFSPYIPDIASKEPTGPSYSQHSI